MSSIYISQTQPPVIDLRSELITAFLSLLQGNSYCPCCGDSLPTGYNSVECIDCLKESQI